MTRHYRSSRDTFNYERSIIDSREYEIIGGLAVSMLNFMSELTVAARSKCARARVPDHPDEQSSRNRKIYTAEVRTIIIGARGAPRESGRRRK